MNIKIVGKNIELGESFQTYSSARIGEVLKKYSYDAVSTQITLEKRIGNFKAKLKVYLKNKIELDATGRGKDANASYDDALDHIEKKLRRYHRRMKSHRNFESKNIPSTNEPLKIYQSVLNLDEENCMNKSMLDLFASLFICMACTQSSKFFDSSAWTPLGIACTLCIGDNVKS